MKGRYRIMSLVAGIGIAAGGAVGEETLTLDGSTTVGPIAKAFAEYFMQTHPGVNVTVSESGSGNGAKALVNGTCDIANMSRFMKDSEFKASADAGRKPVAHCVAMDGLPVIVHPSNPVGELTLAQVRDIYSGKIKNWKELGGPDKEIVVISRDTNSGTYETFYELVMTHLVGEEHVKEKIGGGAEYVGSNGAVRSRVQSTPAAIGYAGLGFVDRTVKALKIEGIHPDQDTVVAGTYPISRPLFLFTDGYPKLGSLAHQFISIYLTPKGQEIIETIGFVPVTKY